MLTFMFSQVVKPDCPDYGENGRYLKHEHNDDSLPKIQTHWLVTAKHFGIIQGFRKINSIIWIYFLYESYWWLFGENRIWKHKCGSERNLLSQKHYERFCYNPFRNSER